MQQPSDWLLSTYYVYSMMMMMHDNWQWSYKWCTRIHNNGMARTMESKPRCGLDVPTPELTPTVTVELTVLGSNPSHWTEKMVLSILQAVSRNLDRCYAHGSFNSHSPFMLCSRVFWILCWLGVLLERWFLFRYFDWWNHEVYKTEYLMLGSDYTWVPADTKLWSWVLPDLRSMTVN